MQSSVPSLAEMSDTPSYSGSEIAIIGMAGRFPGAPNLEAFWENLREGRESIVALSDDELREAGVEPELFQDQNYVKRAPLLDGVEYFDAPFFGYTPREAELIDPQQRFFLECAWEALEDAGFNPASDPRTVGVFAGARVSSYMFQVFLNLPQLDTLSLFQMGVNNDLFSLTSRVSYLLDLKGPSCGIQTACSTSLVAVHLACQSLLIGECEVALAGGAAINVPHKAGYQYYPGGILSPDGHCRAFDAQAQGTIFGNGVGVVVLKRLEDALEDGDTIHAVIKGSAINNDGAQKASFTAPGVHSQREVIKQALFNADVDPATIGYIETHGTATLLGDTIEIRALNQAFSAHTDQQRFCALGSVKTNIGHLDAAAGVAGLIKTVLALKQRQIPPSLHFEQPNPSLDFEQSPFYVNSTLREWEARGGPRRAGVSSFGVGGSNAHVILEEAPLASASARDDREQLLVLSARTPQALAVASQNLARDLRRHPERSLADVAYTLQTGRKAFSQRRIVVAADSLSAADALEHDAPPDLLGEAPEGVSRSCIFMFPGIGSQYPRMGADLYDSEPVFRAAVDRCCALVGDRLGCDPLTLILGDHQQLGGLTESRLAYPALFIAEYALAELWLSWGIQPEALIGHSVGEYLAAYYAGVFSLEDALALVVLRGELFSSLPPGAMLSVRLGEAAIRPWLDAADDLALAAVNGPGNCVVSGSIAAIESLAAQLTAAQIESRRLHTDVAAHSALITPMLEPFRAFLAGLTLNPPTLPYISNVTGTWITPEQATDPDYWVRHLRQTVRFADGIRELEDRPSSIFLEVGPGRTLSTLAKQQLSREREHVVLSTLPHPQEPIGARCFTLQTLGKIWLAGGNPRWAELYPAGRRRRVPLPTYPFERQRYWIEPPKAGRRRLSQAGAAAKNPAIGEWFYLPSWNRALLPTPGPDQGGESWLIFVDEHGLGDQIADRLRGADHTVITARRAAEWQIDSPTNIALRDSSPEQIEALLARAAALPQPPTRFVHCWTVSGELSADPAGFGAAQERGFYSLIALARSIARHFPVAPYELAILTSQLHAVAPDDQICPHQATLSAAATVIGQEYPHIRTRTVDLGALPATDAARDRLSAMLLDELRAAGDDRSVAYRGATRWLPFYAPTPLAPADPPAAGLREGGVYLITGGLGTVGLTIARYLAGRVRARLALLGRSPVPPRAEWDDWIASHAEDDPQSRRLREIQSLERHGAEVLLLQADVADREQMQAALDATLDRFGTLHGVVHAAGTVGLQAYAPLDELTPERSLASFRAKVDGLYVLDALLADLPLDFCLVCSSIAAVLGGIGYAAYAGANMFMDAFVQHQHQRGQTHWISVNWDGWQSADTTPLMEGIGAALLTMTPDEGGEAFQRVIARSKGLPRVVQSLADLESRIAQWVRLESLQEQPSRGETAARSVATESYRAPSTPLERTLAGIWQEVLGLDQIGIDDHFFELGGNSLLALQIVARLRSTLQIDFPLRRLFEVPTVRQLAALLATSEPQAQASRDLPLQPVSRDQPIPLSLTQQRLWFLQQLLGNTPLYNLPNAVRLHGPVDAAALERSFNTIAQRHEILRTTFALGPDRQPIQVIAEEQPLRLELVDLRSLPPDTREREAFAAIDQEIDHTFDLLAGPLMRVVLFQLADDDALLFIAMHHIVSDGWSLRVILQELAALYTAQVQGQPLQLPELPVQYADYAVWQRQRLQDDFLATSLDYWRGQLAHFSDLSLPLDYPRPEQPSFEGTFYSQPIPARTWAGLQALGEQTGATLFMTTLTAFNVLLHYYCGDEDIAVGTPVANRNPLETEQLIGFFVNLLVLRSDLSQNPSFRTALDRTRQVVLDAYSHQEVPFEKLVEELKPKRVLSHTPFVQVAFVFQNTPMPPLKLGDVTLTLVDLDEKLAKFDLSLIVHEGEQGTTAYWNYQTSLFKEATIRRLMAHFATILDAVVADPEITLEQLAASLRDADRSHQRSKSDERKQLNRRMLGQAQRQLIQQNTSEA